jgi:hypothetical protein
MLVPLLLLLLLLLLTVTVCFADICFALESALAA